MISDYISPITPDDSELYRDFFRRDEARYGNSWYYVTQAANGNGDLGLGLKYYDNETLITLGFFKRPVSGEQCIHLIRPLGKDAAEKTAELTKEYKGVPVFVKNITQEQRGYLLAHGFSPIESYPWHPEAIAEDSTFDGQIIDIETTLGMLDRSTPLSRKCHAFSNGRQKRVRLPESAEDAKRLVENFFKNPERERFSTSGDYRNMIKWPPLGKNGKDYFTYVLYVGDTPAGFAAAEGISDIAVGIYANIADYEQFPGASEFLIIDSCRLASYVGYKRLHLGGSETKNLWRFKEKFGPVAYEHADWVVRPA